MYQVCLSRLEHSWYFPLTLLKVNKVELDLADVESGDRHRSSVLAHQFQMVSTHADTHLGNIVITYVDKREPNLIG
jgi:hypothetical protein